MNKKILAVIPARGGSKGVPRKNIKQLDGYPLIAYTIIPALCSKLITDVLVSTEDEEIKNIAEHYGANVPFLRPQELATDGALSMPTMQHAVFEMEKIKQSAYDYVIMLQPTCPFTTTKDIDSSLKKLIDQDADSVISVVDVGYFHPGRMKIIEKNDVLIDYDKEGIENKPRQSLSAVFIRSGDIYAAKRDVLIKENSFKGKVSLAYIIPIERFVNIDNEFDWLKAEQMINLNGNPLRYSSSKDENRLKEIYESAYAKDDKSFFSKFINGKDSSETNSVVLSMKEWNGKKVLDFGCGPGRTSALLAERGAKVTGLDFSNNAIEAARQKCIPDASFSVGSLKDIQGIYDFIVCLGTLEHLENPEYALHVFKEHLDVNGKMVITCPNWTNPRGFVLMPLHFLFKLPITLTDRHYITYQDISQWVENCGLTIDTWSTIDHEKAFSALMIEDLRKRLPKVFKNHPDITSNKINSLLQWLEKTMPFNKITSSGGTIGVYILKRK